MNRMEFMRELEGLLSDIPENERSEALQYYEDYLNDAGAENEQGAMKELGTPEEIARHIKAGLNGNEEGMFTENGYENAQKGKNPPARQGSFDGTDSGQEQSEKPRKRGGNGMKILLTVFILVLLSPIILPFGVAVLGLIIGAIAAVISILIALTAVGVALLVAGFCLFIAGIVKLFTVPLAGALLTGIGLLMLGIGMLLTMLMLWMAWKLVPPAVRGLVNLCQKPFRRNTGNSK